MSAHCFLGGRLAPPWLQKAPFGASSPYTHVADSETPGGKLVDGAIQGVVEGGTTHLGGLAGGAVTGNLVKSEVVGNAASVGTGLIASQGVNGAQALPGIANDALNSMDQALGQAYRNVMQQFQDLSENPTGGPDFDRDDDF